MVSLYKNLPKKVKLFSKFFKLTEVSKFKGQRAPLSYISKLKKVKNQTTRPKKNFVKKYFYFFGKKQQ
jgi:hypothetical protein